MVRPTETAITTRSIWEGDAPILLISHDHDGTWQFLPGTAVAISEGMVVHLAHITEREPRLIDLADLPPGWGAERSGPDAPWERFELAEGDE